jgi:aspartate/methionine/tyrosine aminotransferase
MNPIYSNMPVTVFEVMSGLARQFGAVNLGQGFPEAPGPLDIRQCAAEAVLSGYNQYPPMGGLPVLRQAVAEHYGRLQGLSLNSDTEVTITSGATEALAAALLALITPGDEVVLFEPLYDAYLPLVLRAGGVPRFVQLTPPHWSVSKQALDAAIGPRTRLVVFNNPLNPAGKVFGREDLDVLAQACVQHDLVAVSDEVWEHVVFDAKPHIPLMSLPGMRERTVKIGSAGKMFGLTGWKVGFVCAAAPLNSVIAKAHQFLTFTTPPNLQVAAAFGLGKGAEFFAEQAADLAQSRDRLAKGLAQGGYVSLPCQGTYFLNMDLAASGIAMDDETFCRRAVQEAGIAAIPVSSFYAHHPVRHIVRLCFAKSDETLDRGLEALIRARALF